MEEGIVNCLDYFGLFNYPLTSEEIHNYGQYRCSLKETMDCLTVLVNDNKVFKFSDFYSSKNIPELYNDRLLSNKRAETLLKKIKPYVSIIAHFPFVKSISISGSLSKFAAGENADIDYFIITNANRLWIARSLLHLFKKFTFITGHEHYFCMNYFIDETALKLKDQNIYSAIELTSILPVYNENLIQQLKDANPWVKTFLPNNNLRNNKDYMVPTSSKFLGKRIFEALFNSLAPERFNIWLMRLTNNKWKAKWKNYGYPDEDYDQAFYTRVCASKNHPENYEKKVLGAFHLKEEFNHVQE